MKRVVIISSMLALAITISMLCNRSADLIHPEPTDIVKHENEEEKHKARAEWIEQMHLTAPGVDWRAMDEQIRQELQVQRNENRRLKNSGDLEVLADGNLSGKWVEKGSNNLAGRVHNIDLDIENNKLYAASDGGQIWKGGLNGENWVSLTDHYQVKGVHYFRVFKNTDGSNRIVQTNNTALFRYSDDEGQNWINGDGLNSMSGNRLSRGVNTMDQKVFLLFHKSGSMNYLYESSDSGNSFSLLDTHNGTNVSDIWTSRYEPSRVFFLDKKDLFIVNDGEKLESLSSVGINFSDSEIRSVQLNGMVKNDTVHLHVMYRLENSSRFFSSADGGISWLVKGEVSEGPFMRNSFGVSSINPKIMGYGGVNAYRSENGGATWTMINGWGEYYGDMLSKLHADIPEIEFIRTSEDTELAYISTDGGSYVSTDNLRTVSNLSLKGLNISQYYTTYTHREKTQIIYVGSQDQGFQRSTEITDGVANFEQTISGDYGHIVSSDGGQSLWTVYPGFAMRYPNAISSLQTVRWTFTGEDHYWMPPLMADPYYPERVYLAGGTSTTGNHLWYLNDNGGSISVTELPNDFSGGNGGRISAMAFSPINKDYRYVLNSKGKLFTSSDRGTTWSKSVSSGPGSHYFYGNAIIPDPNDINTIYLGGSGYSGYSFWVSHDGGRIFRGKTKGLPKTLIFEMARNEDASLIFAATEVGPFVYINEEEQWYDLAGAGAPEQTYWSVDYVPALKTARFGTYGRGIWDFQIAHFTGIDENKLWHNSIGINIYPNPVEHTVFVDYNLTTGGKVRISLLDTNGRLIRMIQDSEEIPGQHKLEINMNQLASGLYYVRIVSGKKNTIRKLLKK
ncbi:MAG: T9SS type A sorting domain-containing protein [Bacteroidetes bacterium]|nr:T9SS type A sorting domain-containing protein [Bacteroidota bacterium]